MAHHLLLRRRDVEQRVGLCRSSIYLKVSRGEFPRPVKIGKRAVAWTAADVEDWIDKKIAESRGFA